MENRWKNKWTPLKNQWKNKWKPVQNHWKTIQWKSLKKSLTRSPSNLSDFGHTRILRVYLRGPTNGLRGRTVEHLLACTNYNFHVFKLFLRPEFDSLERLRISTVISKVTCYNKQTNWFLQVTKILIRMLSIFQSDRRKHQNAGDGVAATIDGERGWGKFLFKKLLLMMNWFGQKMFCQTNYFIYVCQKLQSLP